MSNIPRFTRAEKLTRAENLLLGNAFTRKSFVKTGMAFLKIILNSPEFQARVEEEVARLTDARFVEMEKRIKSLESQMARNRQANTPPIPVGQASELGRHAKRGSCKLKGGKH